MIPASPDISIGGWHLYAPATIPGAYLFTMAVAGVTACLGSHLDGLPLPPLFEVNHAPTKQPTVSNHYPGIGYCRLGSFSYVFYFVGVI